MKNKFKKFGLLLGCGLMAVSCSGSKNYSGIYSFILGKENGSNVGAILTLGDEDFVTESPAIQEIIKDKVAKKFAFKVSTNQIAGADTSLLEEILRSIFGEGVNGYYYVDPTVKPAKLHLGLSDLILLDTIPPELIEKLIASTIEGGVVNMQIPVSIDDAYHNLTWQGDLVVPEKCASPKYIHLDFEKYGTLSKNFDHTPGGKINDDAVDAMNKDFKGYFCQTVISDVVDSASTPVAGLYNTYDATTDQYTSYIENYPEFKDKIYSNMEVTLNYHINKKGDVGTKKVKIVYDMNKVITKAIDLDSGNEIVDFYNYISDCDYFRAPHYVNLGLAKTGEIKK